MKLSEIISSSRKVIKNLNNLYISYSQKPKLFQELLLSLRDAKSSDDPYVSREAIFLEKRLKDEIMMLLKS